MKVRSTPDSVIIDWDTDEASVTPTQADLEKLRRVDGLKAVKKFFKASVDQAGVWRRKAPYVDQLVLPK